MKEGISNGRDTDRFILRILLKASEELDQAGSNQAKEKRGSILIKFSSTIYEIRSFPSSPFAQPLLSPQAGKWGKMRLSLHSRMAQCTYMYIYESAIRLSIGCVLRDTGK